MNALTLWLCMDPEVKLPEFKSTVSQEQLDARTMKTTTSPSCSRFSDADTLIILYLQLCSQWSPLPTLNQDPNPWFNTTFWGRPYSCNFANGILFDSSIYSINPLSLTITIIFVNRQVSLSKTGMCWKKYNRSSCRVWSYQWFHVFTGVLIMGFLWLETLPF